MGWPLVTRGRLRREVVAAGLAYRWQIAEAEARATAAERRADEQLDALVRARVVRGDFPRRLAVIVDCDDLLVHYDRPIRDEYERLAHRIVRGLAGLSRDYRGDLRAPDRLVL